MADDLVDELNTDSSSSPTAQDVDALSSEQVSSNTVKVRELFKTGNTDRIIYDISTDGKPKRTSGWRIHDNSQVEISGSGLGVYDQVVLWISGSPFYHKNLGGREQGRLLTFQVEDLSNLYSEGTPVEIQFVDSKNPENSRFLQQKFTYVQAKTDEEQAKKSPEDVENARLERQKEDAKINGPMSVMMDGMGQAIGGVGGVLPSSANKDIRPKGNIENNQAVPAKSSLSQNVEEGDSIDTEENLSVDGEVVNSSTNVSDDRVPISEMGTVKKSDISQDSSTTVTESSTQKTSGNLESSRTVKGGGKLNGAGSVNATDDGAVSLGVKSQVLETGNDGVVEKEPTPPNAIVSGKAESSTQEKLDVFGTSQVSEQEQANFSANGNIGTSKQKKASELKSKTQTGISSSTKGRVQASASNQQLNTDDSRPQASTMSSANATAQAKPLKPPAGLGAMKSLEINLNKTLGVPLGVGSAPGVLNKPSEITKSSNQPETKNQPTTELEGETINLQGVESGQGLEVGGLAEPVVPHEGQEKKPDVGLVLSKSDRAGSEPFRPKTGVESRGKSFGSERPIGDLNRRTEPDVILNKKLKNNEDLSFGERSLGMSARPAGPDVAGGASVGAETQDPVESGKKDGGETQDSEEEAEEENLGLQPVIPEEVMPDPSTSKADASKEDVADKALSVIADSKAGKELVGQAVSEFWWWGFGISSASLFIGLDFLAGAVIMNVYWWRHRKQPELLPMKGWQKVVTVFASVFPFFVITFLLGLFMIVGCNYPILGKYSKLVSYKTTVVGAFIGEDCKYFDITSSSELDGTENNTNPQNLTPNPLNPRGVSP